MADQRLRLSELMQLGDEGLSKLTDKEIRAALRTAVPVANKRLARLQASEGSGIAADALENARRGGGKFGGQRGSTRNKALSELNRTLDFLRLKTSKVKGARSTATEREARIGVTMPGLSSEQRTKISKDAWSQYDKIKEAYPGAFAGIGSDKVQSTIRAGVERGLSGEDLYNYVIERMEEDLTRSAEEEAGWMRLEEDGWEDIDDEDDIFF